MTRSGSVDLVLQLPADLADPLEEAKQQDPEFVHRILRHALARRAVFQELRRNLPALPEPGRTSRSAAGA